MAVRSVRPWFLLALFLFPAATIGCGKNESGTRKKSGKAATKQGIQFTDTVQRAMATVKARIGEPEPPKPLTEDQKSSLAELVRSLDDPDFTVRRKAEKAIAAYGPAAIESLSDVLADNEQSERMRGAAALALAGIDDPRSVPPLADAVENSPSKYVRAVTAVACGLLGRDPVVPNLLLRFMDRHERDGVVADAAASALLKLGYKCGIGYMIRNLRGSLFEREWAIHILHEMTGTDRGYAPDTRNWKTGWSLTEILWRLEGGYKGFQPEAPAAARFASASRWEKWWTFDRQSYLAAHAPTPKVSDRLKYTILKWVDTLQVLQLEDVNASRFILEQLGRTAVPYLRIGLLDSRQNVRHHCIEVLARMGPRGRAAEPDLIQLTKDPLLDAYAVRALGKVGSPGEVEDVVLRELSSSDLDMKIAAAGALGNLGSARLAVPRLRALLAQGKTKPLPPELEVSVCVSLGQLGDLKALSRVLDMIEAKADIDTDVAMRKVEETLARGTRGTKHPFLPPRMAPTTQGPIYFGGWSFGYSYVPMVSPGPFDGLPQPAPDADVPPGTAQMKERIAAARKYLAKYER